MSAGRFSVDEYHKIIEAGILTDDDPVELLEGLLVERAKKTPRHSAATGLCRRALERLPPGDWHVDTHIAVTLYDSEPEPDCAFIRGDPEEYPDRHPGAPDVALAVEVSDAALEWDRTTKQRIYARGLIPTYWIVNLIDNCVEVYTDPSGPAEQPSYRQRRDYGPADDLPLIIDGQEVGRIAVRAILP
jgi:hypothetical protein